MLSKPTHLSLAMIVKNEAEILDTSLNALTGIADETVVVDHYSTDGSQVIAKKYTDNVVERVWTESFAEARIYTENLCSNDYILTWDADWFMPLATKTQLIQVKESLLNQYDLVRITMVHEWNSETGQVYVSELRPILYNRHKLTWEFAIHNALLPRNQNWKSIRILDLPELVFYHNKDGARKWRYEQTLQMGEKSLLLYPKGDWRRARILFLISQDYQHAKKYHRAIELYTEFFALYDSNTTTIAIALEKCALCYFATKQIRMVRDLLNQMKAYEQNYRYQLVLADLLTTEGNKEAAKVIYSSLVEQENKVKKSLESYDYSRFVLHPKHMLSLLGT